MESSETKIYSIGYSAHTMDSFIDTINRVHITAIVDVRSQPYSQFKPEFNRENLKQVLKESGLEYVFLGDNLGARIEAPECYKNGKADYKQIAKHPLFQNGLLRLKRGMKEYQIALMCAEKDPINCHRAILICRHLKSDNINIFHILEDGKLEPQDKFEKRLTLSLYKKLQIELSDTKEDIIQRAYDMQGEKIAYVLDNNNDELTV